MGNRFLDNGETTYTVRLTGLADHTMVRVNWDADFARTTASWGQGQVRISMSGGSSPQTQDLFFYGDWYNADVVGESQNKGRWFKSSGPTLDLTFSIEDITGESYRDRFEIYLYGIQIYTPSISLGGGGTVTEGGNTPMTFGVSRDLPTGYAGTSSGDEAIPDTTVNFEQDGDADYGVDYASSAFGNVTISDSASSAMFSVASIDDTELEPTENATFEVEAGAGYTFGSQTPQSTLSILDDDIEWREADPIQADIVVPQKVNGDLPGVPINSVVQFSLSASDRDQFRHYGETWQDYYDDVTSGSTSSDYHIKWTASAGSFDDEYGSTVNWTAPDWQQGSNDRTVTMTATVDDFNRGADRLGFNDGPATKQATQPVWQITLEVHQAGTRQNDNDGREQADYGSVRLGFISMGNPVGTTGYFGNTEVMGTVGGHQQTGFEFHQFYSGSIGAKTNGIWDITSWHGQDDTASGNNATFYDQDTMHAGNDTRHIFLNDGPGVDLHGDNDAPIGESDFFFDKAFTTYVQNAGGGRISNKVTWYVQFNLYSNNGHWAIGGSHVPL